MGVQIQFALIQGGYIGLQQQRSTVGFRDLVDGARPVEVCIRHGYVPIRKRISPAALIRAFFYRLEREPTSDGIPHTHPYGFYDRVRIHEVDRRVRGHADSRHIS